MRSYTTTIAIVMGMLCIGIGFGASGYFISQTYYNGKVALNTAQVKGLAERAVKADLAYWTITYRVSGKKQSAISELYALSSRHQQKIISLLVANGLTQNEITPGVVHYLKNEYRDEAQKLVEESHSLVGEIEIKTSKVDSIAGLRAQLNALIAEGLDIQNQQPAYHFTRLNEIKPLMLQEATKNARIAANEFASNAGVHVGGINTARQGNFEVRDMGRDYGDKAKIDKIVRVVTHVSFFLTEQRN